MSALAVPTLDSLAPQSLQTEEVSWVPVCPVDALLPGRGAAAIIGGAQIALFRTAVGTLHALGNRDPYSGANVLSRGIVGSRRDVPTVASPMYKQVFDLRTGRCLDDAAVAVACYPVRVVDGLVEVGADPYAPGVPLT